MVKVRPREQTATACPFCRDTLEDPQVACTGCGAGYHFECLVDELNGTCALLGCGTTRPRPGVDAPPCAGCAVPVGRERSRTCPVCNARHHVACVREGRCRAQGCGGRISTRTFDHAELSSLRAAAEAEGRGGEALRLLGIVVAVVLLAFMVQYNSSCVGVVLIPLMALLVFKAKTGR